MPLNTRTPRTPTVSYGDASSVGQLANRWARDPMFVRRLISEGKLVVNDRGLVTNSALRDFYRDHGTELH